MPSADRSSPPDLVARVLYRDGLILIIDKPAGWPVHSGPSGRPSLEDHFDQLRFGLPRLPALAHRLDAETSGCLVLGRHPKALRKLGRLFSSGMVQKTYLAVVHGRPPQDEGAIDLPLAKVSSRGAGWRMTIDRAAGKPALTRYRLLDAGDGTSLLELSPETGRTHQIRVHLAALGCPILGDDKYGSAALENTSEMHLHARRIILPLRRTQAPVDICAPIPQHFISKYCYIMEAM